MSLKFCSLASGSSGNCQFIGTKDTNLLIDAGLTGKYITDALKGINIDPYSIDGILVTHEHADHIKGIGVMMRKYDIPLYANRRTWEEIKDKLGDIKGKRIEIFEGYDGFTIGDIFVKPYSIPHDAVEPVGYTFSHKEIKISIATDLGHADKKVIDEIKDSHLLLLESNHDVEMLKVGRYPYFLKKRILGEKGHLSNETAGKVIAEVVKRGRVNTVLLGHLSKENNFPELAYETVKNILWERKIKIGIDVNIDLTFRDKAGRLYELK